MTPHQWRSQNFWRRTCVASLIAWLNIAYLRMGSVLNFWTLPAGPGCMSPTAKRYIRWILEQNGTSDRSDGKKYRRRKNYVFSRQGGAICLVTPVSPIEFLVIDIYRCLENVDEIACRSHVGYCNSSWSFLVVRTSTRLTLRDEWDSWIVRCRSTAATQFCGILTCFDDSCCAASRLLHAMNAEHIHLPPILSVLYMSLRRLVSTVVCWRNSPVATHMWCHIDRPTASAIGIAVFVRAVPYRLATSSSYNTLDKTSESSSSSSSSSASSASSHSGLSCIWRFSGKGV